MFTNIDKNLLIAALESALDYAQHSVGVTSLEDLTTQIHALRSAFDADPATVTDTQLNNMIATLQALDIPDPAHLSRLLTTANLTDDSTYLAVCSWATLLNKPAKFPAEDHDHAWSEITYKPNTYPSDWGIVANKPATFPPATHTHTDLAADWNTLANKPATFPADPHTHTDLAADWNTLANKPDVFNANPHINQRYFLTFKFPGALTVGRYDLDGLFSYLTTGARLISAHVFCPDPGGTGAIRFGLFAQMTSSGYGWEACTVAPSFLVQYAGSQPSTGFDMIGPAHATPPLFLTPEQCGSNLLFGGGTMFKAVVEETVTGAADAVLSLEFYADFEDFWAYEEFN